MAEIEEIDKDILALEDVPQADNDPDDELYILQEEEEKFELKQIEEEIHQLEDAKGVPTLESLSQAQEEPRIRKVVPPSTLFDQIDQQKRATSEPVENPGVPFVSQIQKQIIDLDSRQPPQPPYREESVDLQPLESD